MAEAGAAASVAFDRVAHCYDATRGFPSGVEARVAEAFVAAGRLGARSHVLELGIGTGRIALPLAAHVGGVVGIDLSPPMLARLLAKRGARRVHPVRGDAVRLPLPAASVDAAVAVHVFHLIPGWRSAVAELARVLRPEGRLLHGGDEQARGAAWARWRERVNAELGAGNVGVPGGRVRTFLDEEGWCCVAEERVAFPRRLRPASLVEEIAQRSWSMTWRLSDDQLARAVAALRAELKSAFPDLEREVEIESAFWVRAYAPPRPAD